ncbi:MAG: fused MFS/spermidine synthase [Rubrivivax sp.]
MKGTHDMALKGSVIFLGAFLLFLVQPIIAKLILPRFGGSVAVWATCLVFFQAAVLLGYAGAHLLVRRDGHARFRAAHLGLLVASLALLPIVPLSIAAPDAGPDAARAPGLQILLLLVASIGLPFTLLAMTSPLLQGWLARDRPGLNPYRLFAVSNLASLAALVAYPWLIEPWLRTATQANIWSGAYAAYVVLLCVISLWGRRQRTAAALRHPDNDMPADDTPGQPPGRALTLGWIALAALGSYELVAITNHLTQNIPSFPMMWLLPLALYLLSFAMCFDDDRWYTPRPYAAAALLALLGTCALLVWERSISALAWQIAAWLACLFVLCMFCHGELARRRPHRSRLTSFYLCVSAGGVLGGALVGLAAPALLPGYFEVEIGLVLLALAVLACLWPQRSGPQRGWSIAAVAVLACTTATAIYRIDLALSNVVDMERNFYGVLRVRDFGEGGDNGDGDNSDPSKPPTLERELVHGRILHGLQLRGSPQRLRQPTTYYTEASGIGRLLRADGVFAKQPISVGAVGMGAGTIATYGKPGDRYRFYEIDPAMVDAAHRHFSFLADSPAQVEIAVGDGRLLLQHEAAQRFDVLVVDAFSGDSIPVHLLTREAVQLYRDRLTPQGVIALHISNRYLDLAPVVARIAADLGLQMAHVSDAGAQGDAGAIRSPSDWVLLARERGVLDLPLIQQATVPSPDVAGARVWTDDYSNIVQVMGTGR